ncbi:MAG: hypothetical protein GY744_19160, partial [Gammaproteobacteria bacterium]|nr:hypothetical protein [Gammaproteobacteria bacterium]
TITGLYDSIDAMRDAVTGLKGDYNFYYTINPVKNGKSLINTPLHSAGKGSTTSDADIDYRSSVFFDFDLQRKDKQHPDCPDVAAGEPTPDEYLPEIYKEAMSLRDYLDAEGWSKPSIAFSGNGYHLVYHTKLSLTDSEKYLPALYTRLNAAHSKDNVNFDTSVKNLSRIGRLYGTVNQKGGRRSKVLSVGDWMDGETMITSIKKIAQAQLLKKKPVAWVSTPETNHLNKWVDGTEILNSFRQLGLYLKEVESGKHWVTCPNAHAHSSTGDTDTVLWVGARSSFHCSHDHCEQINITNVKEYL